MDKDYKTESALVFTKTNARIVHLPEGAGDVECLENVVINPNLDHVQDLPSIYWKLENGHIVPMTPDERLERDKTILHEGVDNTVFLIRNKNVSVPIETIKEVEKEVIKTVTEVKKVLSTKAFALAVSLGAVLALILKTKGVL